MCTWKNYSSACDFDFWTEVTTSNKRNRIPYVFRTDEAEKEETSKCNLQLYPYKFRLDNCLRLKPLIYDSQSHAYWLDYNRLGYYILKSMAAYKSRFNHKT